jgi:drug/metabolite transporter (DMT)-like permease
MNWFLAAILASTLWSFCHYFDKYIVSHYFKGRAEGALIIFSGLIGLLAIPFAFSQEGLGVFNIQQTEIWLIIGSGFLYILSLLPYIYALGKADTSSVVPLFQMIPVLSFFLGVVFLNERMSALQIAAAAAIVVGGLGISVDFKNFRLRLDIFTLMFISSLMGAIDVLVFKMVALETASFWTAMFWNSCGYLLAAGCLYLLVPVYRRQFHRVVLHNAKSVLALNTFQEVMNITANFLLAFASTLVPMAVAWSVNGVQPLFVLIIGTILTIFFPKIIKEDISWKVLDTKILFILVIVLGAVVLNLTTN